MNNEEVERLATYQLAAHRTPAVIRTAGDIAKCACSACFMASYITTAEEVVRAAREYRAAEAEETPRMWKGKRLCDLSAALDEAIAAHDAAHTGRE